MRIIIDINTGNQAFAEDRNAELVYILRKLIDKMEAYDFDPDMVHVTFDHNGARSVQATIKEN